MRIELINVGTGEPVKPDFNPRIPKEIIGNIVRRAFVNSSKEMAQINLEEASPSPPELGIQATRITRQVASGKIDILA